MSTQMIRFALIGIMAMLVHWYTVISLVPIGFYPLVANILAFFVAFLVSYTGHSYWTFLAFPPIHKYCLPRFFVVAVGSFIINEILYFLLLHYTELNYRMALIVVLGSVSILTFTFSKLWAFRSE